MHRIDLRAGRRAGAVLLLALVGAAAPAAAIDVRALPTPVVAWRWSGTVEGLLLGDDRDDPLVVTGDGRATSLDPRDGTERWTTTIPLRPDDCGCGDTVVRVGDHIVTGVGDGVAILDADDGSVVAGPHLGGIVTRVLGPPLVAQLMMGEGSLLMRLDERYGTEVERFDPQGEILTLESIGDRLALQVVHAAPEEPDGMPTEPHVEADWLYAIVGVDSDLRPLWRRELPEWKVLARRDDALVLEWMTEGAMFQQPLDLISGVPGTPKPVKEEELAERPGAISCGGSPADSLMRGPGYGTDSEPARLIHPGVTGSGGWAIDVPGEPRDCVRFGERLAVLIDRYTARHVLMVIRVRTGIVEHMLYLPPDLETLHRAGDRLVLAGPGGLVAIDPLATGPSEGTSRNVGDEVRAILARPGVRSISGLVAELQTLGPEALPFAAAMMPSLTSDTLQAVAILIESAGWSDGAAALAEALRRLEAGGTETELDPEVERVVARAFAAVAGPADVPLLAARAMQPKRVACLDVLAGLGRIGTQPALAALDRALAAARPRPGSRWYAPPSVAALGEASLATVQARVREEEGIYSDSFTAAHPDGWLLGAAERRVRGGNVVVFPSERYGGFGDFWVVERPARRGAAGAAAAAEGSDTSGATGAAARSALAGGVYYLGLIPGCTSVELGLREGMLDVRCAPGANYFEPGPEDDEAAAADPYASDVEDVPALPPRIEPIRIVLGAWRADGDGDGLTDLLERRIGLDPARADTDGDGTKDADDRAPNARRSDPARAAASARDDAATLTIVELFDACAEGKGESELLVVAGDTTPEWRGRSGPTVSLTDAVLAEREAQAIGLPVLRVLPDAEPEPDPYPWPVAEPELGPGERRFELRQGYGDWVLRAGAVHLRRIGERTVVVRVHRQSWM